MRLSQTIGKEFVRRNWVILWFLLGLGSEMQIIASLSLTELFVLIAGPCLLIKTYHQLVWDGVATFFWLAVSVFVGCAIACYANETPFIFALRGYAVTTIIPCAIVVSHWLIRKSPNGFKWFLLGSAISLVLCTFVFQKSVEVAALAGGTFDRETASLIMSGPIFWVGRLKNFVMLLTSGWYLHTSVWLDIPAALFMAFFSLLTTESGRSAALGAIAFVGILLIGGKCQRTMRNRLCQHFWLVVIAAAVGVFLAKAGYETAASNGWLGEKSQAKYEKQTKGDKSLMALLLGGRMESFCGLIACVDKPIIGFGPWAMDDGGYTEKFLMRYGKEEDIVALLKRKAFGTDVGMIQCHAYLTEFWLWFGITGLIFWIYVFFVLLRYLKEDCWAIPQWFAWLACAIPGFCWNIFFSPLNNRFTPILFVVACLMARAVRRGRFVLPPEMLQEIIENERRRA